MKKYIVISNLLLVFYILIFSVLIFFDIKSSSAFFINLIWIRKGNILLFPYASFIFFFLHVCYLIKTKQIDFFKIVILAGNAILMCAVCYFIFYMVIVTLSNNFGHL